MRPLTPLLLTLTLSLTSALDILTTQNVTFNSSYTLPSTLISSLNLSAAAVHNIEIATRFERSNWATGSVLTDPFYTSLPANASSVPAGSLIKLEAFTNTSTYTLASSLALSRIIYQSKTLNGSPVPGSAYILWPYHPRGGRDKVPLVSWGHGTSGTTAECGPSHIRDLWDHFKAPFALALAGYAVVATDYAGLGVPFYADGSKIVHPYAANPAAGNDLLYAAQAAHAAFPDTLTEEFVVFGHSQGGGAAWAAAEMQVEARVPGYLGSIAAAPVVDAIATLRGQNSSTGLLIVAPGMVSIMSDVKMSDILTVDARRLLDAVEEVGSCSASFTELLSALDAVPSPKALAAPGSLHGPTAGEYSKLVRAGGRKFQGPLLVLQGSEDELVDEDVTRNTAKDTCRMYSESQLRYIRAEGLGHSPVLLGTQQVWLQWIDERFAESEGQEGCKMQKKCVFEEFGGLAPRPLGQYQGDIDHILLFAQQSYLMS